MVCDFPPSTQRVMPEPWNMAFNQGDNNTGITILDITEPRVRYCFTLLKEPPLDNYNDHVMVPLSGNEYLRVWSEPNSWNWINKKGVNALKNRPLIDVDSLNEAWPGGPRWSAREEANWFKYPQGRRQRSRRGKTIELRRYVSLASTPISPFSRCTNLLYSG